MKRKINRIRKFKYYLYRYGIHRLLPARALYFTAHLAGLSRWIAEHRQLPFTDFPQRTFDYGRRYELHQFVVDTLIKAEAIDYLEFGVSKGHSFGWWVQKLNHPDCRFYGFDTFTGLPEAWGPFPAGAMSNGNAPPVIDDARHQFYQGLFQQTLPPFLANYQPEAGRRKVIHLDADLYSSTLFVLTSLSPFLQPGDVLLFDEFNVPMHEYKAFSEWAEAYYIKYTVLGQVNNYYQVALRLD
ncbi:MAG: class I SAM-dependent methyltransferase [Lewinella sp.]|nr:class I SAM-dependent methyltransferase [Lewinella sp.]